MTCSELPDAALTVSQVTGDTLKIIARANLSELDNVGNSGFSCLAQNPKNPDIFCSSTQLIEDIDEGIQLWKIDPKQWSTGEKKIEGSLKR